MLNAIGLLEVRGLVVGIEAADAMLKSASVRLLRQALTNPALVSLVVEGDLAACRAALDAGAAVALRANALVSRKEIGRPEDDTAYLLDTLLAEPPPPPSTACASAPAVVAEEPIEVPEGLLPLLAQHKHGCSASEVSAAFEVPVEVARDWLEQLCVSGKLRKRGSRYRRAGGSAT
ncbi:BMC domain-containing protein [Pseudomonas sp. YH-1]|uniref:BMC domain-containing protein n=1 Tax=Pseudomonas sp. YH-1 TaxID=3384787 RepID=UPI003F7D105C